MASVTKVKKTLKDNNINFVFHKSPDIRVEDHGFDIEGTNLNLSVGPLGATVTKKLENGTFEMFLPDTLDEAINLIKGAQ